MGVKRVYGCRKGLRLSKGCTAVERVYGCQKGLWVSKGCTAVERVYGCRKGVRLSKGFMAVKRFYGRRGFSAEPQWQIWSREYKGRRHAPGAPPPAGVLAPHHPAPPHPTPPWQPPPPPGGHRHARRGGLPRNLLCIPRWRPGRGWEGGGREERARACLELRRSPARGGEGGGAGSPAPPVGGPRRCVASRSPARALPPALGRCSRTAWTPLPATKAGRT
jgi:hypothetical protein